MYIRIKTSPSSSRKYVQIVQSVRIGDKVAQKIVRHIGVAKDDHELKQLKLLAESIKFRLEPDMQPSLFGPEILAKIEKNNQAKKRETDLKSEQDYIVNLKDIIEEQRTVSGIHDVYGALFDELGYQNIFKNPARRKSTVNMFKNIVLARVANPQSKRASVDMLEEDFGITLNLDHVYKMMDKLDDRAIAKLNDLAYWQTADLFGGKIDVIFFDCTTIYFESFTEDDFRRNGYSKDLKFNQPQVLLALLVTKEGLPIGYQAYPGDIYEGHTIIPVLKGMRKKYNIDKVVFVADAGMFSNDNLNAIEELEDSRIEYIVGSRLKNTPEKLQKEILNQDNYEEAGKDYRIGRFSYNGRKLIVSYSGKRARKDAHDRLKAVERIKKKLEKEKNPKQYLSNYGYKKYLKVAGKTVISLDEEKIAADSQWDGLHGVITNAKKITNKDVLKQYHNLWNVENTFRITKHDLKVRPVFHWKPRRVKAHLAISFAAFTLVQYLGYRVRLQYTYLSPEKIRQELIRVQTSILYDRKKRIRYGLPSKMSLQAKKIYRIFRLARSLTPYIIKKM